MDDYLINGETLGNIADKIREKAPEAYEGNTVTPEEMPDAVDEVWQAGYNEGSKSVDLSSYQTKHDENLKTKSKEIVDAINELKEILGEGAIDGKTPYIQDGYWYIDGTNTNVKAQGENGKDGADGKDGIDGKDGNDYVLTDADKEEIAEIVAENISPSENKPTDLKGKTYEIASGWEATAGYGNFTVTCDVDVSGLTLTRTKFALGIANTSRALSSVILSGLSNHITIHNMNGFSITDDYTFDNEQAFTITFNDGDTTNESLIDWVTTWGKLQEVEYQPKHDENLETLSKEIIGAINEINKKTVDKIGDIDTYYEDSTDSVGFTDKGIVWTALTDIKLEDKEVTNFTYHRTPIVAGENVTFEVDEENQVVKINAKGGGNYVSKYTVELTGSENVVDIINKLTTTYPDYQLGVWGLIEFTGATSGLYGLTINHYGGNIYNISGMDFATCYSMANNVKDWAQVSVWAFSGYFQPPIPYCDDSNNGQVLKVVNGVPTWVTP